MSIICSAIEPFLEYVWSWLTAGIVQYMKKQAEPTSKGQYECILLAPYHKCGLGFCDKGVAGNNYDNMIILLK